MPQGSHRGGVVEAKIVGRIDERSRLNRILAEVSAGGAQLVLVRGEAGIGKSALISDVLSDWVAAGWGVHVGRCVDLTSHELPFGPVAALLRSVIGSEVPTEFEGELSRHQDLSILLPELRRPDQQEPTLLGDVDRLFDAISVTLVEAAASQPIVVLVEDVHWADGATRDLLSSLMQTLGQARVLIVLTERTRAGRADSELQTWTAELRRLDKVSSVELGGLTVAEMAEQFEVLTGKAPSAKEVKELHSRTKGNAYFSQELIAARANGVEDLPTSLRDFLSSRLRHCSPEQLEVVRFVALAHSPVSHSLLVRLVPEMPVAEVVRELVDQALLEVEGGNYQIRHGLIREVVEAQLLPFELETVHREIAQAMAANPASGHTPADLATMAIHWKGANEPERCLEASVEAGIAAARAAAFGTAADMGILALQMWPLSSEPEEIAGVPRAQILHSVADWLSMEYRSREAIDLIEEALATWPGLSDGVRARLMAKASVSHYHLGQPLETSARLESAERLVADEVSSDAAQVHHAVSKQALLDGLIEPARASAERALAIAEETGPLTVVVEAMTTLGLALGVTGDPEQGIELARAARAKALEANLVSQVANSYRTEMLITNFTEGRTSAGLRALRDGLTYAERHCGPRWRADMRLDLLLGLVESGRLAEATEIHAELESANLDELRQTTVGQTAALLALSAGDLDLANARLDAVEEVAERFASAQETGVQERHRAELARRTGSLDQALGHIDRALELQLGHDNLSYTRESILEKVRIVRALATHGRASDDLIVEVWSQISSFEGPGQANQAVKLLMELEFSMIGGPVDVAAADETARLLRACGYLYEAAQVDVLVIEALTESDDLDSEAADLLRTRLDATCRVTRENGMDWIAERVAQASSKVIDLRGDTSDTIDLNAGLTPREVEVLALLATGMTNKAIATDLFVSPRTVSTHVSSILSKLGVTTRGEAGARYREMQRGVPA